MSNSQERESLQLKAKLKMSPSQYKVCFNKGTERPFTGQYWDHKGDGHYVCASCGNSLFESGSKFDSGTGWPSFYAAEKDNIEEHVDSSLSMTRTEVLCKKCGCHLGHLFEDGPKPTGLRYCINSASIDFKEPKDK